MVLVFGAFILGGERVIELFGLGLAGAVLLDALDRPHRPRPRADAARGKANWWLPRALQRRLPRLQIEGSATLTPTNTHPGAQTPLPEPTA